MEKTVTLKGARIARNARESERIDLTIAEGRIHFGGGATPVQLDGYLILPGLVNAHDHLEFNLFPRLGHGPYPNAGVWADDIHRPADSPVREHLRVPKAIRLWWGAVKNLAAGVTTVLHHNPYQPEVFEDPGFPVRVPARFGWAHSVRFSPDLRSRHASAPPDGPFVIHACEGTDDLARNEIYQLDAAGTLGPSTVLVHGVALDSAGLRLACERGVSMVWCPSANEFTLGRTISRETIDSGIPIALGTDSAMTAAGDLIDELRVAGKYTDRGRLYGMVTKEAARILKLDSGEGEIRAGGVADLVIVADREQTPAEAIADMRPELVMVGGRAPLLSENMALRTGLGGGFQSIEIEDRGRWLVDVDVRRLAAAARSALGGEFRLAGRKVAA